MRPVCLVLPGGVDGHCHMDQPSYAGTACADDFRSGTTSAACGGTTTVIPFAMAGRHDPLGQTVAAYRRLAEGKALIDYAIHPTIQSVPQGLVDEVLPGLIRGGYASLKIFTTYDGFRLDDRAILEVFTAAAREGALVMVHAENDAIIKWRTQDLLARGLRAPRYVAQARPALAEREAIHRVISLAELTGARVLTSCLQCGRARRDHGCARPGRAGLCRDLHPIPDLR